MAVSRHGYGRGGKALIILNQAYGVRLAASLDQWACVDAKVEGLYIHGGDNITPKDIVAHCQALIKASV